jgi:hypothetical protein
VRIARATREAAGAAIGAGPRGGIARAPSWTRTEISMLRATRLG